MEGKNQVFLGCFLNFFFILSGETWTWKISRQGEQRAEQEGAEK